MEISNKTKDIIKRCIKTFIQSFFASLFVQMQSLGTVDVQMFKSLLIGAIATGLCAVMNLWNDTEEKEEGGN